MRAVANQEGITIRGGAALKTYTAKLLAIANASRFVCVLAPDRFRSCAVSGDRSAEPVMKSGDSDESRHCVMN